MQNSPSYNLFEDNTVATVAASRASTREIEDTIVKVSGHLKIYVVLVVLTIVVICVFLYYIAALLVLYIEHKEIVGKAKRDAEKLIEKAKIFLGFSIGLTAISCVFAFMLMNTMNARKDASKVETSSKSFLCNIALLASMSLYSFFFYQLVDTLKDRPDSMKKLLGIGSGLISGLSIIWFMLVMLQVGHLVTRESLDLGRLFRRREDDRAARVSQFP